MNTKDINLVKILDEVWKENELHSGTYKVAALTAMQKLQEQYETKRTEQQQRDEKCTLPVVSESFNVAAYTLYKNENQAMKPCHWSEGLNMILTKGGNTIKISEDEIKDLVRSLPRTFGGTY